MISQELREFYQRWHQKAQEYHNQTLQDYFDKFFTLYVPYNRLYMELSKSFLRKNKYPYRVRYISDSIGAIVIVHRYLGTLSIWSSLQDDQACKDSITSIKKLIEQGIFSIKLKRPSGEPQRDEDIKLLELLHSTNTRESVKAILEIIYAIRCNIFHGHKSFSEIQTKILKPVTILLERISDLLFEKMSGDYEL